ncbi:MAG: ASCH domain-containing protein [Bacillota bacterium]
MQNIGKCLYEQCLINNIDLNSNQSIHLSIVNQPFLDYILNGKKTIESRFTMNRCSPYKKIKRGDIVFIKDSGKKIVAYFIVRSVEFYENQGGVFNEIKSLYSEDICGYDETFWEQREHKKYISLIWIDKVVRIEPFSIEKKDKRAWVDFKIRKPKMLILISGEIGAGKTFYATRLAKQYKTQRNSFSDYIKFICKNKNMEITRQNLQLIGQDIILNDFENFMKYCMVTAAISNNDLGIIDGLRHVKVLNFFKYNIPNTILVYVDTEYNRRCKNITNRDGKIEISTFNNETEREIQSLKCLSDIVITEQTEFDELIKLINCKGINTL